VPKPSDENIPSIRIRAFRPDDANALVEVFRDSVRVVARRDYSLEQLTAWAPDVVDVDAWVLRWAADKLSWPSSMRRRSDSLNWSRTATWTCFTSTHCIKVEVLRPHFSQELSPWHASRISRGSLPSRASPRARFSSGADFACSFSSWCPSAASGSAITRWRRRFSSRSKNRRRLARPQQRSLRRRRTSALAKAGRYRSPARNQCPRRSASG
jgi:hypothetical protein